ncbi:MAG: BatD family protein [Chloroflexota bacterium]
MLRHRFLVVLILVIALFPSFVAQGQDVSNAGQDYFAEVSVDNPKPYVGQQITYRFRFYDAVGVSNPLYEAPDFEGFWRIDKSGVTRTAQQLNNRQYAVAELQTALYPTRPGAITIAPATITLPETVFRAEEKFTTQPQTLDVKPLPDGAPTGFTGAVGQFELSATLDRQTALLGQTFTLKLTVTGTGNVEQLALLDFPDLPAWHIYANPTSFTSSETNGLIVGQKVFEYLFIPSQIGQLDLPTMTLYYFDPATVAYRSINTVTISVNVLPSGEATATALPEMTVTPNTNGQLALKPIPSNFQTAPISPGIFFWLLWLIPPLGVGAGASWKWYQARQRSRQLAQRSSLALKNAQTQLQVVIKGNANARTGYEKIRQSMLGYFGDRLNQQTQDWTSVELENCLAQIPASGELKQRILLCLGWVDEGLYAPTPSVDISTLAKRTAETLAVLDQNWKASP